MAISSTTRRAGPYVGDGSATTFSFSFKTLDPAYVSVIVSDSETDAASESALSSTAFSVSLNADQDNAPGGTVKLKTALADGALLSILSAQPYDQPMVLTNRGGFYPETLNDNADRIVILCQQLKERLDRTIVVPVTSTETPEELLVEILDVARKAGQYAQDAVQTKGDVEALRDECLRVQEAVQGLLASAELVKASVDQSEAEVSRMYALFEAAEDKLTAVYEQLDKLTAVGENIDSVRVVADDLLGLPIESIDLGFVTEAAQPINDPPEQSAIRKVADNIDKLIALADQLADQGGISTMSANLDEIQSTDYDKVLDDGVSE